MEPFLLLNARSISSRLKALTVGLLLFVASSASAQNLHLGDLDDDGVVTVRDLALLNDHISGTPSLLASPGPFDASHAVLADMNKDGAINSADRDELIKEILQSRNPEQLPLGTVRFTSPASGEGDAALTRETIVHFTVPLSLTATLDTTQFYAEFAGQRPLSRVEISSDRKKATLFYQQPLPANSRVKVTFDGSTLTDLIDRPFDADGDGISGGVLRLSFDTISTSKISTTGMTGRVMGSTDNAGRPAVPFPIPGATITVDGAEQDIRTTTAADGTFTLSPCPSGTFFVHIDGRTSPLSQWPTGEYFPSVGKSWEAIPGKADNPAGGTGLIYLPCVCTGTLQTVSPTQTTSLTFAPQVLAARPELADARITVPANSLFADDGTRGGKVGIYPVPPDKLPSALPPGLNLPLVITVQTDGGTNFDRPVPVCLPNLPDPITGKTLAPGEKSALWSFNHDTGGWEVGGAMTVTADGKCVTTDAGVGVRQPGWHGDQNGCVVTGRMSFACNNQIAIAHDRVAKAAYNLDHSADKQLKSYLQSLLFADATGKSLGKKRSEAENEMIKDLKEQRETAKTLGEIFESRDFKDLGKTVISWLGSKGGILGKVVSKIAKAEIDQFEIWDLEEKLKQSEEELYDTSKNCLAAQRASLAKQHWLESQPVSDPANSTTGLFPDFNSVDAQTDELNPKVVRIDDNLKAGREPLHGFSEAEIQTFIELTEAIEQSIADLIDTPTIGELLEKSSGWWPSYVGTGGIYRPLPPDKGPLPSSTDESISGYFYCKIECPGLVQRFRSNFAGEYSRILRPDSPYLLSVYQPNLSLIGSDAFRSPSNGALVTLPRIPVSFDVNPDSDDDGVSDRAEDIIGTDPNNPDTDNDGVTDGAELRNGTDPLSGIAALTGIVGKAETGGDCRDVAAVNDVLAAACGVEGLQLLGVRQGLSPTKLAKVPTPSPATVVAMTGSLVAVGMDSAGTMIVDASTPDTPQVLRTIKLGSSVKSLAALENTVYVGFEDGRITAVDMLTGRLLANVNLGSAVHDLAIGNGVLYAATASALKAVLLNADGTFGSVTSTAMNGNQGAVRFRLFRGSNRLYSVFTQGFHAFDITTPATPTLLQSNTTNQFGWRHLVAIDSRLAVAIVGINNSDDAPHDVSLYDLGVNGTLANFQTTFAMPTHAFSSVIYNGFAYVADGSAGVQVVNVRSFDTLKVPPAITFSAQPTSGVSGVAVEGTFIPVSAQVTDDVQVRNVEFYVDGLKSETDGNFPFETRVLAPRIAPGKIATTLKAKVSDTGGNSTWSNEVVLNITADTTPLTVLSMSPPNGAIMAQCSGFTLKFSEPVKSSTLTSGTVFFYATGADGRIGTDDDTVVSTILLPASDGSGTNRDSASWQSSTPLAPGVYRALASLGVQDSAGNPLAAPFSAVFIVSGGTDSDGDGLSDDVELALSYDPGNQDSNGNGKADGDEDLDGDGLTNLLEVRYGSQPNATDSNGNGINDALEDADKDGLTTAQEIAFGSDPTKTDTDGDGWPDQVEFEFASNPADARSKPLSLFIGAPTVTTAIIGGGTTIASPPTTIAIIGSGTNIATPPTKVRIGN